MKVVCLQSILASNLRFIKPSLIIFIALMHICISPAMAYETDQYTTPPNKLADVGEDFSMFIFKSLESRITDLNKLKSDLPVNILTQQSKIFSLEENLRFSTHEETASIQNQIWHAQEKLSALQQQAILLKTKLGIIEYLKDSFANKITWNEQRDGVFGVGISYIVNGKKLKDNLPVYFDPPKTSIVYALSGFHRIVSPTYFVFASTINMYGIDLGVDKFGHMMNQGFDYFKIYYQAIEENLSPEQAHKKMIDWGIETEDGFFGKIVDGVYSNADLAANFAGFLFYQNLFSAITIGEKTLPPILLENSIGEIKLNPYYLDSSRTLLKPFITIHLNEAFNPNVLESMQRPIVRWQINKRCETIKTYYKLSSKSQVTQITDSTKLWEGYDYGYRSEGTLRLDEICQFDN